MKENRKLLKEVLKDIQHDMTDEEVLNLLADSKISESPATEKYTLGQRAADAIAKFAGSWAFIFSFTGVLLLWMVVNTILAADAFDPFPFILLNLVLSCVAAIQAPLIMMSQNRQEEKDRRRAENDYKVNLKTEIMIEDLYDTSGCDRRHSSVRFFTSSPTLITVMQTARLSISLSRNSVREHPFIIPAAMFTSDKTF